MSQLPSMQEKQQLKQKLQTLKLLYQQKRVGRNNMGNMGNIGNMDIKIMERSRMEQTEQMRKDQIIKEELQRTKEFLRVKKRAPSTVMKQMHYGSLFEDGGAAFILALKGTSLRDRSKLLQMVFDRLSVNGTIPKSVLKDFLRANKEFRERFSIRDEDVHREIDVHTASLSLDYPQFYEFVSACHLTNPIIHPKNKVYKVQKGQKGQMKGYEQIQMRKVEKEVEKELEKEEDGELEVEQGWRKEEGKVTSLAELDAQLRGLSLKHATEIAWEELVPPKRFRG